MTLSKQNLQQLVEASCSEPHRLLGMHVLPRGRGLVVRAFLADTKACQIVSLEDETVRFPMKRLHPDGVFEAQLPDHKQPFGYRLRAERNNGEIHQFHDPYCFLPSLGEQDLYLFNEGNEHFIYRKLGAHPHLMGEVPGVAFAVWAPGARRLSVVGDFNRWDGRYHPMRTLGSSGVWELFIPGLGEGHPYKFEIVGTDGGIRLKSDPFAIRYEPPPHNASIVASVDSFEWGDADWMTRRQTRCWKEEPISIYEVHPGSWKRKVEDGTRPLNYRELAVELGDYVLEHGFTHVEFMPLAEHPFDGSWGYQVTGFFAPTQRFGTPEDFQFLIDYLHQRGIGVLMDWVPGHFPTDSFALAQFDGTHLYEHSDPRQGLHMDWGTLIFNYGRHEVRCFLIATALAWLDRFHIDGFRVDAVASMLYLDYSREDGQWIPNRYGGRENIEAIEFLRQVNDLCHHYYPGVMTIAEESTSFGGVTKPTAEGGLGFDYKWNMGWMNDTLSYFQIDPVHRKYHHNQLTFGMLYQYSENFVSVFSHDEVVHGKGSLLMKMSAEHIPEKARQLRALLAYMWIWPGKKTLFMGCEFGQSAEWSYDRSLDWHLLQYLDHEGIRRCVRDLNHLYRQHPFLGRLDLDPKGFQWVNCHDEARSVISFLRLGDQPGEAMLCVANLTPVPREHYTVGVPGGGFWREALNTNATDYGGDGTGNLGGVTALEHPADGRPHSLRLFLPGMSVVVLAQA